ncbi:MAG: hypothetical protein ABIG70_12825 [Pseudomonadota bacterium]
MKSIDVKADIFQLTAPYVASSGNGAVSEIKSSQAGLHHSDTGCTGDRCSSTNEKIGITLNPVVFSRFTNHAGKPLTKSFTLDADGKLQKDTAAQLYSGEVETLEIASLTEFAGLLIQAEHSQAFSYGLCGRKRSQIVAKDKLVQHPGAIARDREHFEWGAGPGILFLDYDPPKEGGALERDDLIAAIRGACAFLADVQMLWRPSSSSNITNRQTQELLRGLAGQRLYIVVDQAKRIPDIGAAIDAHLWAAGYGRFDVSKSGALLPRTLVDSSVWQPERLDFVAGALCSEPLAQVSTEPVLIPGKIKMLHFNTVFQPDQDAVKDRKHSARVQMRPKQEAACERFVEKRAKKLADEIGGEPVAALERCREVMRQAISGRLFADFKLFHLAKGMASSVSVGEVLDNPKQWHNRRFADPLEPGCGNDYRIAWANLYNSGKPYIFSHAHGGRRYELCRQPRVMQLATGDLPGNVDRCTELLALDGSVFDFGGLLVHVHEDRTIPLVPHWLMDRMGRLAQFQTYDQRSNEWRRCNMSKELATTIITKGGGDTLPRLTAICTAPTMLPDGTLLSTPGHHAESGLLLVANECGFTSIPKVPTREQISTALAVLWRPFDEFPFVGNADKAVHLAALLTAAVRVGLPTAPGFAYDAPTAGSGKTLLASCVAALATGYDPAISSPFTTEDETRKAITSGALLNKRVMLVDNQNDPLDSAVLSSFLSGTVWSDRMLGKNDTVELPNRSLFLLTGNNLTIVGDLSRRILTCRIDPACEASKTYLRKFSLDPLSFILGNRQEMMAAALTVLQGFAMCGMQKTGRGRLASFEQWDDLVRQAICWITEEGYTEFGDPLTVLETQAKLDPEALKLAALLSAWSAEFARTPTSLAEAIQRAVRGVTMGNAALFAALDDIGGDGRGNINSRRVGHWIQGKVGKIIDNMKFERDGNARTGSALWRVSELSTGQLWKTAA